MLTRRSCLPLFLAAVALLAATLPAAAQQPPRWASWELQWENDAFAAFSGSDEHYTNGVRFSWMRNPERRALPTWTLDFGEWWCGNLQALCGNTGSSPRVDLGHSITHTFYTPEDISVAGLIPADRPYAGHLHFGTQLLLRNDTDVQDWENNKPIQNYFELQVGYIAPETGAEWLQKKVHELIDDEEPQGWDNQLPFEPTVQLLYQWRRKYGGTSFDFVPHAGAALGTVAVYANAGASVRWGRHLSDFLTTNIAPTARPVDLNVSQWEYYLFAGADGRAVAHNVFLDGNVFKDSHSVDKEDFVYDLQAGFVVRYEKYRLQYTFTRRSNEFSPNFDDDGGRHDYGALSFTYLTAWPPGGP